MRPIGDLLPSLLRDVSEDSDTVLIFLQELWPRVVGEKFSQYTYPVAFKKNELTLAVTDEAWLKESRELVGTAKRSINRYWGMSLVEKLCFKLHQDESDKF